MLWGAPSEDLVDVVGFLLAFVDDIAVKPVEDRRGIATVGAQQIGGGRQLLPFDLHIVERVGGGFFARCDDRGDCFANMANAVHGKRKMAVMLQCVIAARNRHRLVLIAQIVAGDHCQHSFARQRRHRVYAEDLGVGVGAAHKCHVAHAGQLDVAYVFARTGNKTRILFTFDACSYQ